MNTRGQVFDLAFVAVILVLLVVCFVFGLYIVNQWNASTTGILSTEASDFISGTESTWTYADYVYPVLLVFTVIAIIVTYLYVPTHPALLFVEFIVLFFVVLFGWVLGELSDELFSTTELSSTASSFPIMTAINSNLGLVLAVIGLIVLLVLFLKRGEGD